MNGLLLKIWKFLRLPTSVKLFLMRRLNDQFLIGVTGIILNKKNKVLLFNHTYRDGTRWSLPGGYIKKGEHPKEALEREIEEESGLIVSADERLKLRIDRDSPRVDVIYVGSFIGSEFRPSSEVKKAKFFSFENLPRILPDQLYFIEKALIIKKDKELNLEVDERTLKSV